MEGFRKDLAAWFQQTFAAPSPIQGLAWPVIRDAMHVFLGIEDEHAIAAMRAYHRHGVTSGESGASCLAGLLALLGIASYPVLVHRVAALLHASFRPRLATTPLRFANPSPPSGWIEDFHLQAAEHAQHTTKPLARRTLRVAVGCALGGGLRVGA